MELEVVTFTPNITLPDQTPNDVPIQHYLVWASIPANDDKGTVVLSPFYS